MIIARSRQQVVEVYKELNKNFVGKGLTVNISKSKCMLISASERKSNLGIDGNPFDAFNKFRE